MARRWAKNIERLKEDLWEREAKHSAIFDNQVIIPVIRTPDISKEGLIFIHLESPLHWGKTSEEYIQFILGIFVPDRNFNHSHLQMISHLARKVIDDEFRK